MENKTETYLFQDVHKLLALQDNHSELDMNFEINESDRIHGKLPRKLKECPKTIHHFEFSLRHFDARI